MSKKTRPPKRGRGNMSAEERKLALQESTRKIFTKHGYAFLDRGRVAADCGCSVTMINVHLGSAEEMREWALQDAVERKDVATLKRHIADGYPAPKMPRALLALCK